MYIQGIVSGIYQQSLDRDTDSVVLITVNLQNQLRSRCMSKLLEVLIAHHY